MIRISPLMRCLRVRPRSLLVLTVVGIGAAAAWASSPELRSDNIPTVAKAQPTELPAVDPLLLRDVDPAQAQIINAQVPVASLPVVAAKPFSLATVSRADRAQALECLTSAIYFEAGSETADGQRAVAQVVLNRVRHSAFPSNICGVVFQGSTRATGCQFTFTCDGSLVRRPGLANWHRARKIAEDALAGSVFAPVGLATHYHATYVVPYWALSLAKTTLIGSHVFYRWPGSWGSAAAFQNRYAGREPDANRLKATSLAAELTTTSATLGATAIDDGIAVLSSPAEQLVAVEAKLITARARLGVRHPQMVALEKERRALAGTAHITPATQLKAIDARIASARSSLGARHPEILELQRKRATLIGVPRKS